MYQIATLIGLMLLTWGATIWASFTEECRWWKSWAPRQMVTVQN